MSPIPYVGLLVTHRTKRLVVQLGTSARVLDVDEPTLPGTITRGHRALGSPCEVQGGWQADAHVVVGAAASGVASFAVDSAGRLWAWGYSKRGQLGLGTAITDTHVPQVVCRPSMVLLVLQSALACATSNRSAGVWAVFASES